MRGRARALLASLLLALVVAVPAAAERPRLDTQVFALVPPPGFPARAYVAPNQGAWRVPAGTRSDRRS